MATSNKKILLFADEHGRPEKDVFTFGIVVCPALLNAKIDTHVTQRLPASAGEIHSSDWDKNALINVLKSLRTHQESNYVTMVNYNRRRNSKTNVETYSNTLIEAARTAINKFKLSYAKELKKYHDDNSGFFINNIEMIVDRCDYNETDEFKDIMKKHLATGNGKSISHFEVIDSCASRMLQIADVVAYSRNLISSSTPIRILENECGVFFA